MKLLPISFRVAVMAFASVLFLFYFMKSSPSEPLRRQQPAVKQGGLHRPGQIIIDDRHDASGLANEAPVLINSAPCPSPAAALCPVCPASVCPVCPMCPVTVCPPPVKCPTAAVEQLAAGECGVAQPKVYQEDGTVDKEVLLELVRKVTICVFLPQGT